MDKNGEPRAKRARYNDTYIPCPCYKCQGDLQRPATIKDHKKRYPWPPSSSPRVRSPSSDNGGLQDTVNWSSPRHQIPPQTREPTPIRELDDGARSVSHSPSARGQGGRHTSPPDLPGFNPNDHREHRFNDLGRNQAYADAGVEKELLQAAEEDGDEDEDEDKDEDEDEGGDEDEGRLGDIYGVPGGDDPPNQEAIPFELQWEDRNGPEPDPEPEDPIDPAEYCAAFHEPPLIRNAYVDTIVQKSLYGANHRALTHQLKAAQQQLRSNPDVPAEDLARMALMIRTVER
ncbi:hypothetical protein FRC11_008433 [Ceratobasidium sp. 423]|nr:hypothetical protein FRC11_008433 [Ceratobasidium sp. 423]